MALQVKLQMSFSRTKVVVEDVTGEYDSESNPTGYGDPNEEFSDFAHYMLIRKKNVNEVPDAVVVMDTYNEEVATEFAGTRTVDGWYEAVKFNIPKWTEGTHLIGSVRYLNGAIYKAVTSTSQTPGASSDWQEVTDLAEIENNDSIVTAVEGRVTAYNADLYWSQQIAKNSERGICGVCTDDRQKERLDKIKFHVQCVLVADQMGDNTSGEWNALALINLGAK